MQDIKKERPMPRKKTIDPVDKHYLAFEYGAGEGLGFR